MAAPYYETRPSLADIVMLADGFYDRHHRYRYLLGCEIARRIGAEPRLLDDGRTHLEKFSAGDPRQRDGYRLWDALLRQGAKAVAAAMSDRSQTGDYARETAPCFIALPAARRADLLEASYDVVDQAADSAMVTR